MKKAVPAVPAPLADFVSMRSMELLNSEKRSVSAFSTTALACPCSEVAILRSAALAPAPNDPCHIGREFRIPEVAYRFDGSLPLCLVR